MTLSFQPHTHPKGVFYVQLRKEPLVIMTLALWKHRGNYCDSFIDPYSLQSEEVGVVVNVVLSLTTCTLPFSCFLLTLASF